MPEWHPCQNAGRLSHDRLSRFRLVDALRRGEDGNCFFVDHMKDAICRRG
jgi:hypothetical protein